MLRCEILPSAMHVLAISAREPSVAFADHFLLGCPIGSCPIGSAHGMTAGELRVLAQFAIALYT
jgi:hypothetical protein